MFSSLKKLVEAVTVVAYGYMVSGHKNEDCQGEAALRRIRLSTTECVSGGVIAFQP